MRNLCAKFFLLFITIVVLYDRQIDATGPTRLAKPIDLHEWENVMRKQMRNTCAKGKSEPIWEGKMITESYCRCPDGTYGFDCTERFDNPCPTGKTYHPADQSLANNYFIECMGNVPHLMKCPVRTIWNHKVLTCDWGRVRQGIPRVQQSPPPPQDNYYDRKNTYPTVESQPLVQSPVVQSSYGYDQPQQQQNVVQSPVQQTYDSYDSSSYGAQKKLADIIVPNNTPDIDLAVPQTQTYDAYQSAAPIVKEIPVQSYHDNSYNYAQPSVGVANSYSYDTNNYYGQSSQAKIEPVVVQTTTVPSFLDLQPVLSQQNDNTFSSSYYSQPSVQSSLHSSSYDYTPTATSAPVVNEIPVQSYHDNSYNYAQLSVGVQNSYSYDTSSQYGQASQAKIEPVVVQTTTVSSFLDLQPVLSQQNVHNSYSYDSQAYASPVNSAPVVKETPVSNYNNYAQPSVGVQNSYSYDTVPATTAASVLSQPANNYGSAYSQDSYYGSSYGSPSNYNVYTASSDSYGYNYLSKQEADAQTKSQIQNSKSNVFQMNTHTPEEPVKNTITDEENSLSPSSVQELLENTIKNEESSLSSSEEEEEEQEVEAPVVNKKIQKINPTPVVEEDSSSIIVQTFNNTQKSKVAPVNAIAQQIDRRPVSNILFQALPKLNSFGVLTQQPSFTYPQQPQPYAYPQQPVQNQFPTRNNLLQSVIMPVQQLQRFAPNVVQNTPIQPFVPQQQAQRFAPNIVQSAPIQTVVQQQQPQQQQPIVQVAASPIVKTSLDLIKLLSPNVSTSQLNASQQSIKIDIPFDKSAADPNCQLPNGVSIGVNFSLF